MTLALDFGVYHNLHTVVSLSLANYDLLLEHSIADM